MKITRRSDKGKGGHLLISVPAQRITEVEFGVALSGAAAAETGLAGRHRVDLRAAKRSGWPGVTPEDDATSSTSGSVAREPG